MKNKETALLIVSAIARAGLKPSEITVLAHLMKVGDSTITKTNSEMARAVGMAQPNFLRALRGLKEHNVVGERGDKIYVRSPNSWKAAPKLQGNT